MLSVSCDTIHSHNAWAEKMGGISFPMLSDWHPKGEVSTLYGVYNHQRGNPVRAVFIVDEQGIIRWKKTYPPGILPEPAELLAEIDDLS